MILKVLELKINYGLYNTFRIGYVIEIKALKEYSSSKNRLGNQMAKKAHPFLKSTSLVVSHRETVRRTILSEPRGHLPTTVFQGQEEKKLLSVFVQFVLAGLLAMALFRMLSRSCLLSNERTPCAQTWQLHQGCVTSHPTGF